ncbi:DNA-binding response regulator [Paractinoplanes deccanensis]|uniref:DNA-binding response regulator n=1 Tax=Paractinoplanes deccanensis TaxID=113561 RepID=A0ABQ3XX98_9ACTN|nr:response regulator transcription factor [Actinoplanes deccanensis]GID72376.1 DNA-binding response regulator [Actinoplanes deccanensis]
MKSSIRTLAVVSGNAIIRGGLSRVLAGAPGVVVKHEVDSITSGRLRADPADLLVADLHEQRGSRMGPRFWTLLPPESRVIALVRAEDPPGLLAALQGGVRALLTRDTPAGELLVALQTVRHGGVHVCDQLVGPLLAQTSSERAAREPHLANREIETLRWVAEGLTHEQISRRMGLTEATVSTYVKRIRTKLNAGNKAELTRRAIELGYVTAH